MEHRKVHFNAREKIGLLRRHLVEKVSVSELCKEADVSPSHFYRWQQELFEKGAEVLEKGRGRKKIELPKESGKIARLESKLKEKDEVIVELMGEYVALKKKNGEI